MQTISLFLSVVEHNAVYNVASRLPVPT